MKLADRAVNWATMPGEEAARVVRYSDSSPGCPHTFRGIKYRLYGAHTEGRGVDDDCPTGETEMVLKSAAAEPGDPVGETCQWGCITVTASLSRLLVRWLLGFEM